MARRVQFAVQQFRQDAGQLVRGPLVPCLTAREAERVARRSVEDGAAAGAAAFSQRLEESQGPPSEPVTFAEFGNVPEVMNDRLPY